MKKRLLIGCGLFGIAALAVFLLAGRNAEGRFYQGKSMEAWARLAYVGDGSAIRAVQAMGTNAVPELIRLLQVKDSWFRRQLWVMARKIPLSLRRLLPAIKPPDAVEIRGGAIRALGILGPDAREAVPALGRLLGGPDHQEHWDASAALGRIGKDSLPVLIDALQDRNPDVRKPAAYALAQLGADAQGAVPALARLLLDPDRTVREAAGYSLQVIGAPAAKVLAEAIERGDDNARGAAVQSLLAIARSLRQAEPALIKMAGSENPVSRRQALEALGAVRVPDNPTIKTLTQALSDPVLEVRLAAANSLANVSIRAEPAVAGLVSCLDDPSAELRQAAARALGLIGTPAKAAAPKLKALVEDQNEYVRATAKEALARMGENQVEPK